MPVLYKCNFSAPSRAVLMTIEILKIQDKITYVDVDPTTGDTRKPEYLKKNPLHTVPVLEDGDLILCDSHVIMTYLIAKYSPDSTLYPKDLKIRSLIDERMYCESTSLTPKIISCVESLKKGLRDLTAEQKEKLRECYEFVDTYLGKTQFLVTDYVTLADISCVSSLTSLRVLLPFPEELKNLKRWYTRLEKEAWFQKINATGVKIFADKIRAYGFSPK